MIEKRIIIFTTLVLFLFTALEAGNEFSYGENSSNEMLQRRWKNHKQLYDLAFSSSEDLIRLNVYRKNLEFIHLFNEENHGYELGENQFAHWTHQEYLLWLSKNAQPIEERKSVENYQNYFSSQAIADRDWRAEGKVTPIKNQGSCGSCYAFSGIGAVESLYAIKKSILLDLSEQEIVDCSTSYGNQGCNGGALPYTFRYIKSMGVYPESVYPYTEKKGTCKRATLPVTTPTKITSYQILPANDENSLATAVSTLNPVTVAVDSNPQTFMFYKSGVYSDPTCSTTAVNHAVIVVGVGSNPSSNYIIKNSWGTTWGDKGYMYLARNNGNQCGVAQLPVYPVL